MQTVKVTVGGMLTFLFSQRAYETTQGKEMPIELELFNLLYLSEVKVSVEEVESMRRKGPFSDKSDISQLPPIYRITNKTCSAFYFHQMK